METVLLHLHHGAGTFIPFLSSKRPPRQLPILHPRTLPPPPPPPRRNPSAAAGGRAPVAKPAVEKTVYYDNWFDRLAINYMSSSIQAAVGMRRMNNKKGYEGLVEAAIIISRRHAAMAQQAIVMEALKKAFPHFILSMARTLVAPSKFSRELFASFTTIFFSWLVGPCEVRESEFHGKMEKNVVYIRKCRFLEATNCVGMCTNLCKLPSQKFINKSLGVPTNMVPNFEDQSCEIIFGQLPPADDPALLQPCYHTLCIAKQTDGVDCSS